MIFAPATVADCEDEPETREPDPLPGPHGDEPEEGYDEFSPAIPEDHSEGFDIYEHYWDIVLS